MTSSQDPDGAQPQAGEPEIGAGQYEVGDDEVGRSPSASARQPIEDPEIASGHLDD